jgi:GIY-YIG catalytic domain
MPISAVPAPSELTVDDAYDLLLHPANRVSAENSNYYVYMLFGQGEVLYIGYTDHMSQRRSQHKQDGRIPFTSSSFIVLRDETEAKNLERQLISKYRPPYNRQMTAAVLTGTIENRQADRMEKIRQRDADRLARLEELRGQPQAGARMRRDHNDTDALDWHEDNRRMRVGLWRDFLASPKALDVDEFEAVAYINRRWGEIASPKAKGSLQGFDTDHAVRYGIQEAATISLFRDWIGFNRAMGRYDWSANPIVRSSEALSFDLYTTLLNPI